MRILDSLTLPVHADGNLPSYVPADAEFTPGDVRDRNAWERALDGIDAVFHLAAYQDYLPYFSNFFHVNTVSTALLYEIIVARKLPVQKIVIASSQAVYGEGPYRCANAQCSLRECQYPSSRPEEQLKRGDWEVRCSECREPMQWVASNELRVNPHNQYALSKYAQEMFAMNLGQRYGIATVVMRYSITQGPRQSFRNAYSGVLRNFTKRLLAGQPPVCYEDGQQVRDYIYVGDVARANMLVLEDERASFQPFNVGGEPAVTVSEYAQILNRFVGRLIEPETPGLYRFGDTRHVVSDASKLRALGWEPTKPLSAIAKEYVEWARTQAEPRDHYAEAESHMKAVGALRTVMG